MMMKTNLPDNWKLWLLIAFILVIGCLFFTLFAWLFLKLNWWFLLILVGIFALMYITDWIRRKGKGRFSPIVYKVLSVPIILSYFFIGLIQPFTTIVGTFFFVALYAFGLPAIILFGISQTGWIGLMPETIAFVVIALGSILCSTSYKVTKWIVRQTPLKNRGEHKHEAYREDLAGYLIHPNNVVFLMYLIYFIYLGISGFLQIQYGVFLISDSLDSAFLKAFLVFIAFTNMRTKAKDVDIDAKDLVKRILLLFVHDDA